MRVISLLLCTYLTTTHSNSALQDAIDLTWPFNNKTIAWDQGQKFEFTKETLREGADGSWYAAKEFVTAEHCGTHLDAPYHFDKNGWKVSDIPLPNLRAHGIKIDLSAETESLGHEARLLPKHLIEWEQANGPIPPHSIILVYFNWGKRYVNKLEYLGGENAASYKFPGVSPEAAQWIANTTKVLGVGLDTASIDPGVSVDFSVHTIFAKNRMFNLENVKIPSDLPEKDFQLFIMPMLLSEGTGAPVRIVAYLNQKR